MKHVVLLTGTNKTTTGGGRVLGFWAERLAELGVRLHVAFPGGGSLGAHLESLGLPQLHVKVMFPRRFWPFPFLRQARRVRRYVRRERIAVVSAFGCNDYPLVAMATRGLDLRVGCHMHWPRERDYLEWIFRLRKPDLLVPAADWLAERERDVCAGLLEPSAIQGVPNGVDPDAFSPADAVRRAECRQEFGIADEAFCVGIIATIQRRKGCHGMVKLVAGLRQRGVPAVGVLAGPEEDPAYAAEIRAAAEQMGVSDGVRFLGFVQDIRRLYGTLDIQASFSATEVLSLATLESMASGVPLVSYDHPSQVEAIGDAGSIVTMDDEEAFLEACVELAEHPDQLAAVRQAARDRVCRRFSADASTRRLVDVYGKAMKAS
jgi:glycosyltransferase involved in cell wall biosynthesis